MNWSVRADLPTPPLPTIMTLCKAGCWALFFFMAYDELCTIGARKNENKINNWHVWILIVVHNKHTVQCNSGDGSSEISLGSQLSH